MGSTLLLAATLATVAAAPASAARVEKVPDILLPDLHEKETAVRFNEAPVTLVNFWATWCLPCLEEMPQIDRLARKYADRGFRAVGIALESGDAAEVRAFVDRRKLGLSYALLMGDGEVSEAFGGIDIVPTTFLVGRGGRVLSLHHGVTGSFEASVGSEIEKFLDRAAEAGAQGKD